MHRYSSIPITAPHYVENPSRLPRVVTETLDVVPPPNGAALPGSRDTGDGAITQKQKN